MPTNPYTLIQQTSETTPLIQRLIVENKTSTKEQSSDDNSTIPVGPITDTTNHKTKKKLDTCKKRRSNNELSTMAKLALERGGRHAVKATHGSGCRHYGILDLRVMDSNNFKFYLRNNGWLVGKSCIECEKDTSLMTLDKITDSFLMHCEMELKSPKIRKHANATEMESFNDHDCVMILCIVCWKIKVLDHERQMTEIKSGQLKRCSAWKK